MQSFIKIEKFLGEANLKFTFIKFPILFNRKYKNVNVKFALLLLLYSGKALRACSQLSSLWVDAL